MASSGFKIPDIPTGQSSGDFAKVFAAAAAAASARSRSSVPPRPKKATPSAAQAPSTSTATERPKIHAPQPSKRQHAVVPPISTTMQPPPSKRPRLSMCPSVSPDSDLESERNLNDMSLKSRFEQIFDKYGHDFTGIGDEINVMSGQVVVDNGHILSMQDETDTGYDYSKGRRKHPRPEMSLAGRSLLLSMSEEGGIDSAAVEDVIQSIEVMAREATAEGGIDDSADESEEDPWALFLQEGSQRRSQSASTDSLFGTRSVQDAQSGSASDQGSLDESQPSVSADSLLGEHEDGEEAEDLSVYSETLPEVSELLVPGTVSNGVPPTQPDGEVGHSGQRGGSERLDPLPAVSSRENSTAPARAGKSSSAPRASAITSLDGGNDTPPSESRSAPTARRIPPVAPRNIGLVVLEGYESDDPLQ